MTPSIITLNKSTISITTNYDDLIAILRITVSIRIMSLSIVTVSLTCLSITMLSITMLSITMLSKTILSMMA
jgi:hypothetical protein